MNLRKLKKQVQEKHGWWDTTKIKSIYDYPGYMNAEYYMHCDIHNKAPRKYVHPKGTISMGRSTTIWRDAP